MGKVCPLFSMDKNLSTEWETGMEINEVIRDLVLQQPDRMILSNVREKASNPYRKTTIRPVMIRSEVMWQIERFTEKQAFQENVSAEMLPEKLEGLFSEYLQMDSWSKTYTAFVKISQKGKVLYRKKPALEAGETCDTEAAPKSQNREKKYLLEAKDAPRPLVDLGVVTKDGKVVAKRYDKFKQINRFVEMIDEGIEPSVKELNIIDFGCGKSYLTFVLYDYLTRVRKIKAHVVGLDLKEQVIKDCNRIAASYGYSDLRFEIGDINGYQPDFQVDMVISLHACDTATDFALYNAIQWKTPRIYSVPCCQHEVNHQVGRKSLSSLSEYGLIKERFAALLTDALRADILTAVGYKTDILEFVDMQHSPKNLLIRAVKTGGAKEGKAREEAKKRIEETTRACGVMPTLWKLLKEKEEE